jgi:uncharacterized protein (DUF1015 family)
MAQLLPFRALRPPAALAERVASVPYDVVDADEAREIVEAEPLSFLRVVRPEVNLARGTDPHDSAVYRQGAAALRSLEAQGALERDPEPALYLYRLEADRHVQTGAVGCCAVDEYDRELIRKHERTRPEKEADRTRHLLSLGAHAGPLLLAYRGREAIDREVERCLEATAPLYDFAASDGVRHTVWKAVEARPLCEGFHQVPALYVADGHHRAAAASRARAALRVADPDHDGSEKYNHFLAVLFPAEQLQILPYNRVVRDLGGRRPEELLAAVAAVMSVTSIGAQEPEGRGSFGMYLDGRWHHLRAPRELVEAPDPVASLDAAILQDRVLGPLLGVDDPRTSDRIAFVGGARGLEDLARRVDAGEAGVAFALHPLGVEQLLEVADAGRILPPKSTWFEPKLRSGLLVHEF